MIDLHTHSDASDGEFSPSDLVKLAAEAGITALALTDHDTMTGLKEAGKKAGEEGIRFIPGVETEVRFEPGEFHLLGLDINQQPEGPLDTFLREIRRRRNERNREMISLMNKNGLDVSMEELNTLAGGEITGRMHFARWLINRGKAKNIPDCFERWLGPGCPFYVPKHRPELEEAIRAIHASGGKAVIAHPMSLWISWGRLEKYMQEWKETGLDGIEARHSGASRREAARLEDLAERNGMFITGGSDFHGSGRPDRRLGYGPGGIPLEDDLLDPFNET
jgi:predicted metal-dependent phosphoesterase TrpH